MKKMIPIALIVAGLLMAFNKPLTGMLSPTELDVSITHPPVIMPAIYKVYENDEALEGKYSVFKMVIKNKSSTPAKNVVVKYKIDKLLDWTEAKTIPLIQPGQTVVVNAYPQFDQSIVDRTTESRTKIETEISGSNVKKIENDFQIPVTNRNEFMYTFIPKDEIRTGGDYYDNMDLLSCFVTPNDPIIKYFTQQIQEKILKGETAAVGGGEKEQVRVMQGIYYATLASHMVYSGTSGVPTSAGDVNSIVQNIRLPREVVTGKTGLCIELSVLYASIMAAAGMDPVIYLIPGHAYPGFKTQDGKYYAIESTAIGGEGIGGASSPDQAMEAGMKNLEKFFENYNAGNDMYKIVDIRASLKNGAQSIELKDDAFLRGKIDEIARSWQAGAVGNDVRVQPTTPGTGGGGGTITPDPNPNPGGGGGGNVNPSAPAGFKLFNSGGVKFYYPKNWQGGRSNQIQYLTHYFRNPNGTMDLQVYKLPGQSPDEAMAILADYIQSTGSPIQYNKTSTGNGYTFYTGTTGGGQGSVVWMAGVKKVSGGYIAFIPTSMTDYAANNANVMRQIINSAQ